MIGDTDEDKQIFFDCNSTQKMYCIWPVKNIHDKRDNFAISSFLSLNQRDLIYDSKQLKVCW